MLGFLALKAKKQTNYRYASVNQYQTYNYEWFKHNTEAGLVEMYSRVSQHLDLIQNWQLCDVVNSQQ